MRVIRKKQLGFAGLLDKTSLSSWFQLSYYLDSTTATHFCLVFHRQPFSLCSVWWMQQPLSSWICQHATTSNHRSMSCIGYQSSKESCTSCVYSCTWFISYT